MYMKHKCCNKCHYVMLIAATSILLLVIMTSTHATVCVSVASGTGFPNPMAFGGGTFGNGPSSMPSISASGRYVAYTTSATNLITDATPAVCIREIMTGNIVESIGNARRGVLDASDYSVGFFTYDHFGEQAGTIYVTLLSQLQYGPRQFATYSVSADSEEFCLSADSQKIGYVRKEGIGQASRRQVWMYDYGVALSFSCRISQSIYNDPGNGDSFSPAQAINGILEVGHGNCVSGEIFAYLSTATNLDPYFSDTNGEKVDLYLWVRTGVESGINKRIAMPTEDYESISRPSISADGRYVTFALHRPNSDEGNVIYVYDATPGNYNPQQSAFLEIDTGACDNPVISGDGQSVTYTITDNEISQVYSRCIKRSEDPNDNDLVGPRVLISKSSITGKAGNANSYEPAVSYTGDLKTYSSAADNLVIGDTNQFEDVYLNLNPLAALYIVPQWGEPVELDTGVEAHKAFPDLTVYNSLGPSVTFQRNYRTDNARIWHKSPGLTIGWTYNYDVVIESPDGSIFYLHYSNGKREVLTPQFTSQGQLTGNFVIPIGAAYTVHGECDSVGQLQSITVTHKDRTQWIFTPRSSRLFVLTKIVNKVGRYISLEWDALRRLTSVKDDNNPEQTLLTIEYNATDGLLKRIYDRYNREVSYSFNTPQGLTLPCLLTVSQITVKDTQASPRWSYGYINYNGDPFLHTHTMPSPTGQGDSTLTINYDISGRVTEQIDGNGIKTVFTYGNASTSVEVFNGTMREAYWTQHFDRLGRDTGKTDANGRRTFIEYGDIVNNFRPTRLIDKDGRSVTITYDNFGNVISITK